MKISWGQKRYELPTVLLIFILAVLVRLILLLLVLKNNQWDYQSFVSQIKVDGYYEIAVNLWQRGVYSLENATVLTPDSFRTPGYPLFIFFSLWLTKTIWLLLAVQITVASLLPVLIGRIARRAGLAEKWTFWLMIFLALDPFGLSLSLKLFTEIFFTFFLWLSLERIVNFLLLVDEAVPSEFCRYKMVLSAGVWLGVATLFRPTTLYLPVLLLVSWFSYRLYRRRVLFVKLAIVFLIASFSPLAPWILRNYQIFNTFSYSAAKDVVFYVNLAPSVLAFKEHITYGAAQREWFARDGFSEVPVPTIANGAWFRERALKIVKENPGHFLLVGAVSTATFFSHDGVRDLLILGGWDTTAQAAHSTFSWSKLAHPGQLQFIVHLIKSPLALVILVRLMWVVVTGLFFLSLGYITYTRRWSKIIVFLVLIAAYFSLTTVTNGLAVNARFRFPINGLIFVVIGLTHQMWLQNELKNRI